MMDQNATFEIVNQRQADLRAMAQRPHTSPNRIQRRQQLGRLVVSVGHWIAGHEPALLPEPFMTEAQT